MNTTPATTTPADAAQADTTEADTTAPAGADHFRSDDEDRELWIPAPRAPAHDTITPATEPATGQTDPVAAAGQPHAHDVDPDEINYASLYTVTAADRPGGLRRGNLAVLIRYWTRGEGRAKIRFGTGGDFNRCVRYLSKYVPPNQVQGFCARLHKIATGQWPGRGRRH